MKNASARKDYQGQNAEECKYECFFKNSVIYVLYGMISELLKKITSKPINML